MHPDVRSDRASSGATSDRPARNLSAGFFLGLLGGSPSSLIGRLLAQPPFEPFRSPRRPTPGPIFTHVICGVRFRRERNVDHFRENEA